MRARHVTGRVLPLPAVGLMVLALSAGCASSVRPAHPATPASHGEGALTPDLVARASASVVYVLGTTRRGPAATTTRLFRSDNEGRSFFRVGAPILRSAHTGKVLPVRALTFLSPMYGIAVVGPPQRHEPLLVTHDGARSWHPVSRDVRLYRSKADSPNWFRVTASGAVGAGGAGGTSLAAWGSSVWLTAGNGVAPAIGLLASANSGRSFHRQAAMAAFACGASAASPTVAWVTCSEGMSLAFTRYASGARRALPVTGAGTGNTFLNPLSASVAIFGTALGRFAGLYVTRNGGRSFAKTGRLPGRSAGISTTVTFLTPNDGFALAYGGELLRTTNGGKTWVAMRL
jgi:photosystem II stability/assembly factor-like uncharacterized protein